MAKGPGSIPGKVTKILKATQQKKKKDESPEAIIDLFSASKIVQQVTSIQSQEYRLMSPLLKTLKCEKKKKILLSIEKTKENYLNKEYKQKFFQKLSWKEMWY